MKITYKIILINFLIFLIVGLLIYKNKNWYRGRIDFYINENKSVIPNVENPNFLLEEIDYKLVGKILLNRNLKNKVIQEIGCSYKKNCDLLISWKYKKRAIHDIHMEIIADNQKYIKKALNIFPKECYKFLNEKNKEVLKIQIKSLEKAEEDLLKDILKVESQLKSIYKAYNVSNEYTNLLKEFFKYLKMYLKIKEDEINANMFFNKNSIYQKELLIKEKIIKRKLKNLEKVIFNNNYNQMKIRFLKDKLNTLTEEYLSEYTKLAFYKTLAEKGNIYYLFIVDIIQPIKLEKPSYIFLTFWLIVFNVFLALLLLLLKYKHLIRG